MSVKTLKQKAQDKALSAAVIAAFFAGTDAEKASQAHAKIDGSRLNNLLSYFPNTSVEGVKTATKEYKDAAKAANGGKEIPQSAKNRAGEIQVLYGAVRFHSFKPDGMGYHDAVKTARDKLKDAKVKWDGSRIPEKWEREVKRDVERNAQVELAVAMERKKAEQSGKDFTDEQAEEIKAKAQDAVVNADMIALGRGLLKKYGPEKCGILVDKLEGMIASEEQSAKDRAAQGEQQEQEQQAA